MFKYIKESSYDLIQSSMEKYFFNVPIVFKDPFLSKSNINVDNVFKNLKELIPYELVRELDRIYIGQFNHLSNRDLLALYDENVIYVHSIQPSEEKLILAIVHEFAHVAEDLFGAQIYADKLVKKEFLQKRLWLYEFIKTRNDMFASMSPPLKYFVNVEYDLDFDAFLFQSLGYDFLLVNTCNVFPSAYSITDIREYFAIGFEKLFSRNKEEIYSLSKMCPKLYEKLVALKFKLEGE